MEVREKLLHRYHMSLVVFSGIPDQKIDVFLAGTEICADSAIHSKTYIFIDSHKPMKNCTMLGYIDSRQCNIFSAAGVVKCNY